MHTSFSNTINQCLEDIKENLTECNTQITIINEQMDNIEKHIHEKRLTHETSKFIQKYDELSVKNSYMLHKQNLLIDYHQRIKSMIIKSRRRRKSISDMSKGQKLIIIKNLINFYREYRQSRKAKNLQKYIELI